ncbi:hypothetical protein J3Q64DRAFT_1730805 [Phycomyces blakesleeanus]|uniref:Uncharacterized protein n=1 Tax=Phycomyces blakesleeanus TaxID=4837 RepID=A0ABR3B2Q3_PHYBL
MFPIITSSWCSSCFFFEGQLLGTLGQKISNQTHVKLYSEVQAQACLLIAISNSSSSKHYTFIRYYQYSWNHNSVPQTMHFDNVFVV